MKCRVTGAAAEELLDAVRHYTQFDRHLGRGFKGEFDRTVSLLAENPRIGRPLKGDYRRILMRRFPYAVIYQVDIQSNLIRIVAVVDQRRRPDWWRSRVEDAPAVYAAASRAA